MSTFILPQRPEDVPSAFAERFNSGDADAVRELYEPDAAAPTGTGAM
ncbi:MULTISPECIES: hypothetical protein [Streptomyces]|nr:MULTISPECIES: hypothetical protein [Streptomyces]